MTTQFPEVKQTKIVFRRYAPDATTVHLAGTFNDWSPEATALEYEGAGEWVAWLMLRPGHYQYRFVVDGVWGHDPRAAQSAPNPYGGLDSLLTVEHEGRADYC